MKLPDKFELARMLGEICANPRIQQTLADKGFEIDQQALADIVNKTHKHLQENFVPIQTQAVQKPYWIIVSDEGHAAIPHKHFVKAEAEKEAQRLTEKQPGVTFTVFESKSSVFTPKSDTKKTEYANPPYNLVDWSHKYFYPYGGKL